VSKPRVAIYYWVIPQTGFRNDGPPLFWNYNLRKLLNGDTQMEDGERNVRHLWPVGDTSNFGKYDLHLLVDHGEDALGVPLDFEYPHPNAYVVSDAHLGYAHRLSQAKKFDFVFCNQKRAMDEFVRDGVDPKKLFWMPHAVEPDVYKPYPIIEKYDWAHIGYLNCPERVDILDRFCKEIPNWYLGWRTPVAKGFNEMDDAAKKFCQARLILNYNIKDDVNMRNFESLATGKCVLTKDIPTIHDLFVDGKHHRTYKSVDEAVEIAKHLLAHDEERARIGQEGLKEILAKHTYMHRVQELLEKTIGYKGVEHAVSDR